MSFSKTLKALLAAATLAALALPALAGDVKISGLPTASALGATDVIPVTQGSCPSSCATNGATGAQLKTWAQSGLSAASLSNGVTGSGAVVLASAPTLTTPTLGVATVTTLGGKNAVSSITLGATAQVGTGASVACATSHACTSLSGEITLTTGTGTLATGTLFTLNFADTRANIPNCVVGLQTASVGVNGNAWFKTETVGALALSSDSSAIAASTAYAFTYVCGGN